MKKAILAVSFGTSYPDTLRKTIAATEQALAEAFPDWEVRRAFTSGMIIRKLKERDGVEIENVAQAMQRLEEEIIANIDGYLRSLNRSRVVKEILAYHKTCKGNFSLKGFLAYSHVPFHKVYGALTWSELRHAVVRLLCGVGCVLYAVVSLRHSLCFASEPQAQRPLSVLFQVCRAHLSACEPPSTIGCGNAA